MGLGFGRAGRAGRVGGIGNLRGVGIYAAD